MQLFPTETAENSDKHQDWAREPSTIQLFPTETAENTDKHQDRARFNTVMPAGQILDNTEFCEDLGLCWQVWV